jgi:hypothetical protein
MHLSGCSLDRETASPPRVEHLTDGYALGIVSHQYNETRLLDIGMRKIVR